MQLPRGFLSGHQRDVRPRRPVPLRLRREGIQTGLRDVPKSRGWLHEVVVGAGFILVIRHGSLLREGGVKFLGENLFIGILSKTKL